MFVRTLYVWSVAALLGQAADTADEGWELKVTNAKPVPRTCYDAPGLPDAVRGTYFIAGPAQFDDQFDGLPGGNWKYQAVFDGLGMANKFELHPADQPSKICYTSAWMNTQLYDSFVKDHKEPPRGVIFEDTSPSRKQCLFEMCDYLASNDNNWVNMIPIGDEAVWVSDTLLMIGMDPKTMNVTGPKAWADDKKSMTGQLAPEWMKPLHMARGGSAHPLPLPGTQSYVTFVLESPFMGKDFYVTIYTFDPTAKAPQNRRKITSIPVDTGIYMHSFGVTPNYVVLPFNLIMEGIGPMVKGVLLGHFQEIWKGMHVVNLKDGSVEVFDDATPFDHAHIANTFENASGIVMDVGAFDHNPFSFSPQMDIKLFLNKTARDVVSNPGAIRRYHLNNITKKTTVEHLLNTGREYDFYKINPAFNGVPYCIYYAVEWFHDDKAYASTAIMKHDICQNKISYWTQKNVYVNEPYFIGSGSSVVEDEGTVVFTALDGAKRKAIFVALDAKSFKEIERVELPSHIPFTAHGSWIPAAAKAETVASVIV